MKKLVCHLWIVSTIFVLSGCGTDSGVVKTGEDTYKIYKRAGTGFHGGTAIRARALTEANEYCACQGKVFKKLQMYGSHPPYILGNFPKMTLEFMCLDPDDQRLTENVNDGNVREKDDIETKMKALKKLLADGLITQSDFEEQKGKLLNDYTNK